MNYSLQSLLPTLLLTAGLASSPLAQELPSGAEVMARYTEVTGGAAAYAKLENRIVKADILAQEGAMRIPMTIYAAPPNSLFSVMDIPGQGEVRRGVFGDVVWESSPMSGDSVKKDKERDQMLRVAVFERLVHWQKSWTDAKCTGLETIEEAEYYVVALSPRTFPQPGTKQEEVSEAAAKDEIKPDLLYFARETGLLERMKTSTETPGGVIPVEMKLQSYIRVDGVLIAHRTIQKMMGMELVTEIRSIEHNVELPADCFALPKGVQRIVDRSAKD